MRPVATRGSSSASSAPGGRPAMRTTGPAPGSTWRRSGRGDRRGRSTSGESCTSAHPHVRVSVYSLAQWPAAKRNHNAARVWLGPRVRADKSSTHAGAHARTTATSAATMGS
eukprot:15448545-Alexandrium_andersonii.AAC.1